MTFGRDKTPPLVAMLCVATPTKTLQRPQQTASRLLRLGAGFVYDGPHVFE